MVVLVVHGARSWLPGGWLGVDVFFVLSGFLITTLLLQEFCRTGTINLRLFYVRRVLRLFPAMAAMSVAVSAFALFFLHGVERQALWREVLAGIFYVYNVGGRLGIIDPSVPQTIGHLWSLATEEQFYLVWPPLLLWLVARTTCLRVLAASCLVYIGIGVCARSAFFDFLAAHNQIIFGCLFALVYNIYHLRANPRAVAFFQFAGPVGALCLVSLCLLGGGLRNAQEMSVLISLASVCVMGHLLVGGPSSLYKAATVPVAIWVGRVSYGLYLWHLPVYKITKHFLLADWPFPEAGFFLLRLVLTFLVVWLSYRFVELPALRLKNRFHAASEPAARSRSRSRSRLVSRAV